jgi:hypothetical protein
MRTTATTQQLIVLEMPSGHRSGYRVCSAPRFSVDTSYLGKTAIVISNYAFHSISNVWCGCTLSWVKFYFGILPMRLTLLA